MLTLGALPTVDVMTVIVLTTTVAVCAIAEKDLVIVNASSKAPRRELREASNDDQSSFVRKLFLDGRFAGREPCCGDPKRGQREVADDISLPDPEGTVFGAACACFENGRRTVLAVFIVLHSTDHAVSTARATNGREGIQIFLSRDDWLCLREASKFQATCGRFGPDWTFVRSPLVHVLSRSPCDVGCCLSIVSQRRDQLQESGHACLQRRLCQQLHREEWKRHLSILGTRTPPVKADKWADSQLNSKPIAARKAARQHEWRPRSQGNAEP